MGQHHKTKQIYIGKSKLVNIDVKIVPLVKWLNNFESVETWACCEGGTKHNYQVYVLFSCNDQAELIYIISKVQGRASIMLLYDRVCGIRFKMVTTAKNLPMLIKRIQALK